MLNNLSIHIKAMSDFHKGQFDIAGTPYYKHPLRVLSTVFQLCNQVSMSVCLTALFHDVIEDSKNGKNLLHKHLHIYSPEVADNVFQSVVLLTKPKSQKYADYMDFVLSSGNETAIIVKHADIIDHWVRLPLILDSSIHRRLHNKYEKYMNDISIIYPKLRMIYPAFEV